MTLNEIERSVAKYLQRDYANFDVSGADESNLIRTAMNNARKHAERVHDFSVCRQKGYLSVTTKVEWASPTWWGGSGETMKKGKLWYLRTEGTGATEFEGTDRPLKMISAGVQHSLVKENLYDDGVTLRYPDDSQTSWFNDPLLGQAYGVMRGKYLELYPVSSTARIVVVDGYKWWPNWGNIGGAVATSTIPASALGNQADDSRLEIEVIDDGGTARKICFVLDVADDGTGLNDTEVANALIKLRVVSNWLPVTDLISTLTLYGFTAATTGVADMTVSSTLTGTDSSVEWTVYNAAGAVLFGGTPVAGTGSTNYDTTDWWTENAGEFLMWRGVCEANRLYSTFTGNREGNMAPPTKEADAALQTLIANDVDSQEGMEIETFQ